MITLQQLNLLDFESFIGEMGNIIEHCPVVSMKKIIATYLI